MSQDLKVGALAVLGAFFLLGGINAYSKKQSAINEISSCATINTSNAVSNVERDLLARHDKSLFGEEFITLDSILFHNETIGKQGTRVIVPFTLIRSQGQSEYEAEVRCSDFNIIKYTKL
ncbi:MULTISPECIES: hypothetical protein [Pantoea]|uniref:hypothetical protein n=1 Tax=Pantoea TaxID=53335 RepID=UPI0028932AF8|nr:hypothetical protein [Pantoea sp. ACRSB]MCG7388717.1 hypothetical protein [Pantoea sp. ACRSB]